MTESLKNRSCTGKARHKSFKAAQKQMSIGKKNTRNTIKENKLGVYYCQFCGGYHVGSQPVIKKGK